MDVDPKAIRPFKNSEAFAAWLEKNHDRAKQVFLRIYKKGSGKATITHSEAIDVALCWGWIDAVRLAYDEDSFLQRFTPRGKKSRWSDINRKRVAKLEQEGRMTVHGRLHVDAAKADGRWDAAYLPPSQLQVPADLLAAIEAAPKALAVFKTLNKQNLYALSYRTHHLKTPEGRAKRIRAFVEQLNRGETPHPNTTRKAKKPKS